MTIFAPDLSYLNFCAPNVTTAYVTDADAGSVWFPGIGETRAYFVQIDGGSDNGQVVQATGGRTVLTTNDADNDAIYLGFWGPTATATGVLPFLPVASSTIRFGIKMKVSDIDKIDLIFGLGVVDTEPFAAISDGIYLESIGAATVLTGGAQKDSSEETTATTQTISDDTYFEAGFVVHGVSGIDFYVNDVKTAWDGTASSTLDDDEPLTPFIAGRNFGAQANTMTIERLICTQSVV